MSMTVTGKLKPDGKLLHMKTTPRFICPLLSVLLLCISLLLFAEAPRAETVVCDEASLSVKASNMKAEDLITAIGNACGIKMVLRGELFTEDVYSVQFEKLPVRAGLERVLRIVNIPNNMMHFSEIDGRQRVVEINLIGTKGGERQLTAGASQALPIPRVLPVQQTPVQAPEEQLPVNAEQTPEEDDEEEELAETLIDLFDDILDKYFDDEDEPDPAAVMEMFHQAIPEEMRGNIPPEVMEEIEWMLED
jgi:hypothetical protein